MHDQWMPQQRLQTIQRDAKSASPHLEYGLERQGREILQAVARRPNRSNQTISAASHERPHGEDGLV